MWSQLTSIRSKFFSVNRTSQLLSIFCWYGFPKNDGHAWHRLPMICPINVNILYTIHSTVPWQARPVSFCLIRIQVKRNIRISNRLHSSMVSLQQSPLGSWEKNIDIEIVGVCRCVHVWKNFGNDVNHGTYIQLFKRLERSTCTKFHKHKHKLQCKRFFLAISNASNGFQKILIVFAVRIKSTHTHALRMHSYLPSSTDYCSQMNE